MITSQPESPLVDPGAVPDTFVSGLGEIEDVGGGCLRFTLYRKSDDMNLVVLRVIVPSEAVPGILLKAGRKVGFSLVRVTSKFLGGTLH